MIMFPWCDVDTQNQFETVPETKDNPLGVLPNKLATSENLVIYYSFLVKLKNRILDAKYGEPEEVIPGLAYDEEKLSEKMIEEFKASKLYQEKSEKERQDIIDAINDNPYPDTHGVFY